MFGVANQEALVMVAARKNITKAFIIILPLGHSIGILMKKVIKSENIDIKLSVVNK